MLFRLAGVRHTDYAADRALFPVPADRVMVSALLVFALLAPWLVSSLALSSYLLPWLVWTSATLGLNLIIGWAGQFHFGYAAVMAIGAYTTVHAFKAGIPWEIAIVLGGLMATVMPLSSSSDSDWSTPWMLPHSTPAAVATSDDSAHEKATPRSTEMPTAHEAM